MLFLLRESLTPKDLFTDFIDFFSFDFFEKYVCNFLRNLFG